MAVVASQHSQGVLLSGKPNNMASTFDQSNGKVEVNGHSTTSDSKLETAKTSDAPSKSAPIKTATENRDQNHDAFATNQSLSAEKGDQSPHDKADANNEKVDQVSISPTVEDPPSPKHSSPPGDTISGETAQAAGREPEEEDVGKVEERKGQAPDEQEKPSSEKGDDTAAIDVQATEANLSSSPSAAGKHAEVEMADAPAQSEAPTSPVDNDTKDERMLDASAGTPKDEMMIDAPANAPKQEPAPQQDGVTAPTVDGSKASPSEAPLPADSRMTETQQSSAKNSRERDDDDDDDESGRAAKRAKIQLEPANGPGEGVGAASAEEKKTEKGSSEAMDVDQEPSRQSPDTPAETGQEPRSLVDPVLDDRPITEFQSRSIRSVLQLAKKTKAGGNFKQPVATLWPQLKDDYLAKVTNPIDISTMEKKLKGDDPNLRYENMAAFKADLDLLVQNTITYNGPEHTLVNSAVDTRSKILEKMAVSPAAEPTKVIKKDPIKHHPTRHVEPRPAAVPTAVSTTPVPKQKTPLPTPAATVAEPIPSAPAQAHQASPRSGPQEPVQQSPAYAIPPGNNGVPLIRHNSRAEGSRPKRPLKTPVPKDIMYTAKRNKKLSPDLRFCEEVITEISKPKHWELNKHFLEPVDTIALNIPTYYNTIKKPMDLETIRKKLANGEYGGSKEVEKDVDLIVKNCKKFNGEEHALSSIAYELQKLFKKEMAKKATWMARHAPASVATAVTASASDSGPKTKQPVASESDADEETEAPPAEPEPESGNEEVKELQGKIAKMQERIQQEQDKINTLTMSGSGDVGDIEVSQMLITTMQTNMMNLGMKLRSLVSVGGSGAKKASTKSAKPSAKPASKPKKASGGGSKKAATAEGGGSGGGGGGGSGGGGSSRPRKSGGSKKTQAKLNVTVAEKEAITSGINRLSEESEENPQALNDIISIIKHDTGQDENAAGELELDIDQLSGEALVKLWEVVSRTYADLKTEAETQNAAQKQDQQSPVAPKPKKSAAAAKKGKNKPMSKDEQEKNLQQLREKRAQFARQGSGSEEPMESIEAPTDTGAHDVVGAAPEALHAAASDDDESSEEE